MKTKTNLTTSCPTYQLASNSPWLLEAEPAALSRCGNPAPGLFREAARRAVPWLWASLAFWAGIGTVILWGCM